MTSTAGAAHRSTRLLSATAILFIIAGALGLIGNAILQYSQSIVDPPDTYGSLGVFFVSVLFSGLGAFAVTIAFVLLFAWQPGFGWQLSFLLTAFSAFAGPLSFVAPDGALVFIGLLVSVIQVVAGVVVFSRRIFGRFASLVFLVTMVVPQLPRLVELVEPSVSPVAALIIDYGYVSAAAYLACGFAMVAGVRTRSTATGWWESGTLPPQQPLPPWSSE